MDALSSKELINASIEKRANFFSSISFEKVISFKENLRHLKPLIIALVVFLLLSFIDNSIIFSSAERIINYGTESSTKFPFELNIENSNLTVLEQSDFELSFDVLKQLPKQLFLKYENKIFTLKKNKRNFQYTFKNVTQNVPFLL